MSDSSTTVTSTATDASSPEQTTEATQSSAPQADSNDRIWRAVLGELELTLSKAGFTTWFKQTTILRYEAGEVMIAVPNMFTRNWLQNKYHKEISRALQNVTGDRISKITYELHSQAASAIEAHEQEKAVQNPVNNHVSTPSAQSYSSSTEVTLGSFSTGYSASTQDMGINGTGLNRKYTFDNYIVGSNNELARAAAIAVTKNPGTMYNPLYIYGGVGLGKTHLVQSIGTTILANDPTKKVVYVTCEKFTDDFIKYIQEAKGRAEGSSMFKEKYRSVDVLIIDDIQFLSGKERTQEEFFHTFNELHQNNRQVVITSDRPPKAILHLEDRLISRFEGGMIADISLPDFETRKAILQAKCDEKQVQLPQDVIDYVAQHIQSNIREIEGAISRVMAHCELNGLPPTIDLTKQILSNMIASNEKRTSVTPKQILEIVANFYNITVDELLAKNRKKEIVWPRQIAMYLMRVESKTSYPSIGQYIGGRDHTTAIHAYEKVCTQIEKDDALQQEIEILRQKIYL